MVEIGSFIFKISQFINPKQNYITLQQTLNIYKSKDLLADLKLNTQNRSLSAIYFTLNLLPNMLI
jgi:hypothetical protein